MLLCHGLWASHWDTWTQKQWTWLPKSSRMSCCFSDLFSSHRPISVTWHESSSWRAKTLGNSKWSLDSTIWNCLETSQLLCQGSIVWYDYQWLFPVLDKVHITYDLILLTRDTIHWISGPVSSHASCKLAKLVPVVQQEQLSFIVVSKPPNFKYMLMRTEFAETEGKRPGVIMAISVKV